MTKMKLPVLYFNVDQKKCDCILEVCLNFCVDDITTLMLTGTTRLEPCVLIQNPIIWEFNPDWEFTVSEHLDTEPHRVGIHP